MMSMCLTGPDKSNPIQPNHESGLLHRCGGQQPIAFLKALIESRGYYDMDKHFKWKHLEDLNFIAAMGAAVGVRYTTDERFLARFFMFQVDPPTDESLGRIYTTMLTDYLSSFSEKVRLCVGPLVEIMLSVFRVSRRIGVTISSVGVEKIRDTR